MKTKAIGILLICFSIQLCIGQTTSKKLSDKELEQINNDYKVKKKKNKAERKELDGTTLTKLSFKDINGNNHTIESLKGKVVLFNFWFIQCKPCVAEIPDLNTLKTKFEDKEVVFFAVALNNKKALEPFLEKTPFDFTIIPDGRELADRFKIPHYPYNVLIDPNGKIEYVSDVLSLNIMNRLKRRINGLLKK